MANVCGKEVKDIDASCVEAFTPFICLKMERSVQISHPVPNTTLVFIALTPLNRGTGMFKGVDLYPGNSLVLSGDRAQVFEGGSRGGGIGIIIRIKLRAK